MSNDIALCTIWFLLCFGVNPRHFFRCFILGNTAQESPNGVANALLVYFPSYVTKILVNT